MTRRADQMREVARTMRESYAVEKLDAALIVSDAARVATLGFMSIRIRFDRPLDLQNTEAAHILVKRLTREGFRVFWEPRRLEVRDSPNGEAMSVADLVISWDGPD